MPGMSRRGVLKTIGAVSSLTAGGSIAGLVNDSEIGNSSSSGRPDTQFVGTWTASPQPPYDEGLSNKGFEDQTLRLMTRTSVGGQEVRIRLTNTYGNEPVTFDRASIGVRAQADGAAVESNTLRQLTFGGDTAITLTPGGRVLSDPVDLQVEPEQDLAISLYTANATGPTTWHQLPTKTSYVSASGDQTDMAGGEAFTTETLRWYFLDGVEVISPDTVGAIACLGNSITDGFNSTVDANAAYPDVLAERVNDRQSLRKSVLNAGISGNRVLNDSACCGVNALARFDRDIIAQSGVTDVILLEGINDIGFSRADFGEFRSVTAAEIIDGYQQLIRRAHAKGIRIIGGTLTPFEGAGYYYEEGEQKRQQVNEFIRTSNAFDGVVDFDKVIRDPDNPQRILPRYDSGDRLHPSDAGYKAMADAIDLTLFQGAGRAEQPGTNSTTANS